MKTGTSVWRALALGYLVYQWGIGRSSSGMCYVFSVSVVPRGALVGVWCGAQGVPSYVASAVRFEVGLNKAPVSRAYHFMARRASYRTPSGESLVRVV